MKTVSRDKATIIGFVAIVLWATLALFTALTNDGVGIPPFQLLFLSFFIGATINTVWLLLTKQFTWDVFSAPPSAWLLSVSGLFLYHFFYFNALRYAPEVEASLIAYLWPLLIVLFSALLPNNQLHRHYIIGAFVSFCGAGILILWREQGSFTFENKYMTGYLYAFACALIWSLYSVFNRLFTQVPSSATVGFCYVVALLSLVSHFLLSEIWVTPTVLQWVGVVGLGIGPVGIAFFVWDYGTKHGDIQLLGTLSYCAPLLSTLLLIIFSDATLTIGIAIGCSSIILGAIIAVFPKK